MHRKTRILGEEMRQDELTKELRAFIEDNLKERDMSGYYLTMDFLKYKNDEKIGDIPHRTVAKTGVRVSKILHELLKEGKVKILRIEESRATIKRKIWRWVG